ncbi:MAG: threonine synthase [Candidatus Hadarchaeum sp.]|uniref:threonine synthase n=1 Tax=Candidatus Hadarchaeum sp. TaxID=2883567 RepID=UPI00317A783B
MWDAFPFLPVTEPTNIITLGEGGTPLLSFPHLHSGLWVKNEGLNPTGSFKDRPLSVIVSAAKERGAEALVTASSGNAGVALSAYSAKAGIPCLVVVGRNAAPEKIKTMQILGAKVVKIEDGDVSQCVALVREVVKICDLRVMDATTTFRNPLGLEGDKTVAYEIIRDMGKVPDWVIVPIGSGPLLVGIYKGFEEVLKVGLIDRVPRMVGVQASGCAPIARSFITGERVKPWSCVQTIAAGIADPLRGYEVDGEVTLRVIRRSGGQCISVSDNQILAAMKLLASKMGIFVEPSGAASLAGFLRMCRDGLIAERDSVVCLLTGQGFKEVNRIAEAVALSDAPIIKSTAVDYLVYLLQFILKEKHHAQQSER